MINSISVGIASKQPAKSKTATAGHRFEDVKKNLTRLAEEQWLSARHQETVLISEDGFPAFAALAEEEEQMLRCLGAALIIRWDTLPKKLRRELFDNAGLLGELFGLSRKM